MKHTNQNAILDRDTFMLQSRITVMVPNLTVLALSYQSESEVVDTTYLWSKTIPYPLQTYFFI